MNPEEINGQISGLEDKLRHRSEETTRAVQRHNEERDRDIRAIQDRQQRDIDAIKREVSAEMDAREQQAQNAIQAERQREAADRRMIQEQLQSAQQARDRMSQPVGGGGLFG